MHLLDVTEENWHAIMDVNALGTLIGIQEGARRMIPRPAGQDRQHLVDRRAGRAIPSFAPYCASKFAVNALTQAAARALAEHDITCNAFAPGVVDTPLWTQLDADLRTIGDAERARAGDGRLLRRDPARPAGDARGPGGHGAVPRVADSDYLTGQVIMVDGGMVLV